MIDTENVMIDREHETTEQKIQGHAYALWLAEGQPEGRADEHWRLAQEAVEAEALVGEGAKREKPGLLPARKS